LCNHCTKLPKKGGKPVRVIGGVCRQRKKRMKNMKLKKIKKPVFVRLRPVGCVAFLVLLSTASALAQSTSFNSTDLKTGLSNSLAVIMMFGFVLGVSCVIYGGFAIRRGDVDQGKMSIIGGLIIAAAPAVVYAFYTIFGLNSNSAVGVGNF
jgi:hypothetical protein